jgi:hypothetical protein
MQWFMPIISAPLEVKIGRSWFETNSDKKEINESLFLRIN